MALPSIGASIAASAPPSAALTIHVLLFASAADALGGPVLRLALPAGATVGDVRRAVVAAANARAEAAAATLPATFRIAVGLDFADDDRPVAAGDEVAVIPPVAGG